MSATNANIMNPTPEEVPLRPQNSVEQIAEQIKTILEQVLLEGDLLEGSLDGNSEGSLEVNSEDKFPEFPLSQKVDLLALIEHLVDILSAHKITELSLENYQRFQWLIPHARQRWTNLIDHLNELPETKLRQLIDALPNLVAQQNPESEIQSLTELITELLRSILIKTNLDKERQNTRQAVQRTTRNGSGRSNQNGTSNQNGANRQDGVPNQIKLNGNPFVRLNEIKQLLRLLGFQETGGGKGDHTKWVDVRGEAGPIVINDSTLKGGYTLKDFIAYLREKRVPETRIKEMLEKSRFSGSLRKK